MQAGRKISRVILTAIARDGALYAVVVCADASLGLTRNGELVEDARWEAKQMDACVEELMRRTDGIRDDRSR